MWFIWIILLISYGALTWQSLLEASAPAVSCQQLEDNDDSSLSSSSWNCYRPAVRVGDELSIQLELFHTTGSPDEVRSKSRRIANSLPRWTPVETCRIDLVVPPTGKLPTRITSGSKTNNNNSTVDSIPDKLPPNQRQQQQCEKDSASKQIG